MQISFDPGTEQYIPFAKRKLVLWKQQMGAAGVGSFHKRVDVSDGSTIYVDSTALGQGRYNDRIRITGGYQYVFSTLYDPGPPFARYTTETVERESSPSLYTDLDHHTNTPFTRSGEWEIVGTGGIFPMGTGVFSFVNSGVVFAYASGTWGMNVYTNYLSLDHVYVVNGNEYLWPAGQPGLPVTNAVHTPITDLPEYASADGGDPLDLLKSGTLLPGWETALRGTYPLLPGGADVPVAQTVVVYFFAPVIDGVSQGMFGSFTDPGEQFATEVLGKVVLRFAPDQEDEAAVWFTFVSWADPVTPVIDVTPPTQWEDKNIMVRWNGASMEAPDEETVAFRKAILAAFV